MKSDKFIPVTVTLTDIFMPELTRTEQNFDTHSSSVLKMHANRGLTFNQPAS